ncbi:MFS transporter [Rubrobacter tropicus]|uniref:MFS transporter n=2 Tax=Rubrobacter tropicus TaxID=2653851 RepID=A0A6G8QFP0_9ACTN|nr:MFS transporter [Rubrobacter tropicus]
MFDAMDVGLLSFVMVALAREWGLSQGQVGIAISAGLFGMFVGAAASGTLADRYGRRAVLMGTLLLYSVATGLTALAWGYGALLVLRFVTGLGLGGELPVASTLVSEVAPAKHRGRMVVLLESFWAYGWILAALIGFLVIPQYGWRVAFLIGALPALYVLVLRRGLPESPRYLIQKGRHEEARRAAARLGVDPGEPGPDEGAEAAGGGGLKTLWSAGYARRTFMLWVLWFGMVFSYYGIFTWLPQILAGSGRDLATSFGFVLLITLAQVPGYFSAAYLVERWGRKGTLVVYLLGCAVAALFFGLRGLSADASGAELVFWGSLVSFFNLGAWGVVYGYTPELYPTGSRGSGAGWAAGVGRTGGIAGPYLVGVMIGVPGLGAVAVFSMFAAVLVVIAANVWLLGEETRGRPLDEISGKQLVS